MLCLAFNVGGDPQLAFLIVEDGVAEVVVTDHERASIPSAIFIYRDEGPPDHMFVVVDHQIFLEVNRATLGHVELIESQGAFHRSALDHPGNIPQLGDVEGAPIHAWQVPLQTRTKQTTFELE
ncbi:hypothetical protein D3C81_1546430 [compost metagenome]